MDDRIGPARSLADATIARSAAPRDGSSAHTARASIDAATDGPMNDDPRAGSRRPRHAADDRGGARRRAGADLGGGNRGGRRRLDDPGRRGRGPARLGDPARSRARRVRRRPHRDPGDRRCAPARRAVRRRRHRRDARYRRGAGALCAGPRSPRTDGAPRTGAARTSSDIADGRLETTPIEAVVPGDLLAIRPGEVVPVDGMVAGTARPSSTSPRSPASPAW